MTIRLYLDGSTTPISQAEAADGTFAISLVGLSPGSHTLAATAQLPGQNESSPTAPRTFQGPPAPVVLPPPPPPPPVATPDPQAAGTWANVTPSWVDLRGGDLIVGGQDFDYGVQDVVADPNNPGTAFAGVCYQGIIKSTDFGRTWAKITNGGVVAALGASPDPMDCGRPALAMAPDGGFMVCTQLYPVGVGQNGCWKSSASDPGGLGARWRRIAVGAPNGDDIGSFHFDPGDSKHIAAFSHTPLSTFFESRDSGETWHPQPLPAGMTVDKLNFIAPGILLAVAAWGGQSIPSQVGSWNGTTWIWQTTVTLNEAGAPVAAELAFHGAQQVYCDAATGASYIGGSNGVHRSKDGGKTWTQLSTPQGFSEGLVATAKAIYSSASYASDGAVPFAPSLQNGPHDPAAKGSAWKAMTAPAAMNNGWVGAAVVNDGTHSIILAGCWDAGLWRFVEA